MDKKKLVSLILGGVAVSALVFVLISTPVVYISPKAVSIEGNESVPVVVTFGGLVDIAESKVSSPYTRVTIVSNTKNRWNLLIDADTNLPNGEYDVVIYVRAPYMPLFQKNTMIVHVNREVKE